MHLKLFFTDPHGDLKRVDVELISGILNKVDRPKRHHASRKPVGGESIPALGFYVPLTSENFRLPLDFNFSIVFTVSELSHVCVNFHS